MRRAIVEPLPIGGFEPFSTVDWPGQLAAVVFCQGCTWRCRYCHNPELQRFSASPRLTWEEISRWLDRRRGLLDGIVFSGGEATLQPGLPAAIAEARARGFRIGLHTAGPDPEAFQAVLPLVDWVGFDFKAPFASYREVVGADQGSKAARSLDLLLRAGIGCEIRTTWHPHLLSLVDLTEMAATLVEMGVTEWVIQRFRPEGCDDVALCGEPVSWADSTAIRAPGLTIRLR